MGEGDKPPEPDEAYALERFANLTDEERENMTDADIMAMLREEYWEMLDTQSGQVEVENAEIESSLIPSNEKH